MIKTDVLIIGAGAVGSALARELSKYNIAVTVVDKNDDVGGDASKSNSGLFSTSATMPVGTLECKLRTIAHSMILCYNKLYHQSIKKSFSQDCNRLQ